MCLPTIFDPIFRWIRAALALVVACQLGACGSRRTEAEQPATTSGIVAPPPEFEMNKIAEASSASPPPAPDAGAKRDPAPPPKKVKTMQPVFTSDKGVTTIVGTPGAVFKVAGATLRIPEDALPDGKDIHFVLSKSQPTKGEPVRLGATFDVGPALTSVGPPFEITLPLSDEAGDVVLATVKHTAGTDGKGKVEIVTVAPKSVDAGKHEALFELPSLPEGDVFVTKKPASAEPAGATSATPPANSAPH